MQINHRIDLHKILARPVEQCHAVEIGVASGLFSEAMLDWGLQRLYLVDAWQKLDQTGDGGFEQSWHTANEKACRERLSRFGSRAVYLKGLSKRMCEKIPADSLDLVYLDGDHSYIGVMTDLMSYWPRLRSGGVMAGHDYLSEAYGTFQAVSEFTQRHKISPITIHENDPADAGFYFVKP